MLRNDLAPLLSLDGVWRFRLGDDSAWQSIQVPGCWEAQGYDKLIDGPAYYQRTFSLPAAWAGQLVWLEFAAVSYACTVYINGVAVDEHCGLWTPFACEISQALRPGAENSIEVVVWKPGDRYPMRSVLAGFLPDVATTFGGLWQSVQLRQGKAGFADLRVDPDFKNGDVQTVCRLNDVEIGDQVEVTIWLAGQQLSRQLSAVPLDGWLVTRQHVLAHQPWSPDQPVLYSIQLRQLRAGAILAQASQNFGFRRLSTLGEQLLLNDQPITLRGALSWGWNAERIAPNYTADAVRQEIRQLRALGFNLVKLCLFVPNQSYFDVADEEGMLLWQEWPLWLPEVNDDLRKRAPSEYGEYMHLTRHHPAVVLYSVGCELDRQVDEPLLRQLNEAVRSAVHDVLVCDNSGSGEAYGGLTVDLADFDDYHTYGDLNFLEPMLDHWRRDWKPIRPLIFGEFCDSDGFRDYTAILAANQGQRPWWLTADLPVATWRPESQAQVEFAERLAKLDLGRGRDDATKIGQLVRIANQQSLMVRKWTIETVRKRANVKGYVITGLADTPIATSGIFDDLGNPKWQPAAYLPFNSDAILALDIDRRRVWRYGGDRPDQQALHTWWAGEMVRLPVVLSASRIVATQGLLTWKLTPPLEGLEDLSEVTKQGRAGSQNLPGLFTETGRPCQAGVIEFTAPLLTQPMAYSLTVSVMGADQIVQNQWPLWVYPRPVGWQQTPLVYDPSNQLQEFCEQLAQAPLPLEPQADLPAIPVAATVITTTLDRYVLEYVAMGGRVLYWQPTAGVLPVRRAPFWRESLKLFYPDPLWQHFPHSGFADLQFWGVASDCSFTTTGLAGLPGVRSVRPILRRLDARDLTCSEYLCEVLIGAGRLLVCSLRLAGGNGAQPSDLRRNVAGQYLLWALID